MLLFLLLNFDKKDEGWPTDDATMQLAHSLIMDQEE